MRRNTGLYVKLAPPRRPPLAAAHDATFHVSRATRKRFEFRRKGDLIMRRREGDGCPLTGALQIVGDKWTLLIVRDLACGPRRTTALISALHPISSRTLVERLRDLERDTLIERRDHGGSPPHVEYVLTTRGRLLLPLLDVLRQLGESLDCNDCDDRRKRSGAFCNVCPRADRPPTLSTGSRPRRDEPRDSIVLL